MKGFKPAKELTTLIRQCMNMLRILAPLNQNWGEEQGGKRWLGPEFIILVSQTQAI
jgi:hypothetical protein